MKKRERIILALVVFAILGAGIDYAMKPNKEEKNDLAASSSIERITRAQARLPAFTLDDFQRQVLEGAAQEWPIQLFSERTRDAVEDPESPDEQPETVIAYTGVFKIGTKTLGIINGQEYIEGEWLLDQSHRVLRFWPDRVELKPYGSDGPINIPLDRRHELKLGQSHADSYDHISHNP